MLCVSGLAASLHSCSSDDHLPIRRRHCGLRLSRLSPTCGFNDLDNRLSCPVCVDALLFIHSSERWFAKIPGLGNQVSERSSLPVSRRYSHLVDIVAASARHLDTRLSFAENCRVRPYLDEHRATPRGCRLMPDEFLQGFRFLGLDPRPANRGEALPSG